MREPVDPEAEESESPAYSIDLLGGFTAVICGLEGGSWAYCGCNEVRFRMGTFVELVAVEAVEAFEDRLVCLVEDWRSTMEAVLVGLLARGGRVKGGLEGSLRTFGRLSSFRLSFVLVIIRKSSGTGVCCLARRESSEVGKVWRR